MKRTVSALLGRGVDLATAQHLADAGYTLTKLKQMDEGDLIGLGLGTAAVRELHSGSRPPIPPETISRILYRNRFQCCVCRDPSKSIILHHVNPWAQSRDHGEHNLAVLCLQHHAQAHSVSSLAQNLDAKTLKGFKQQWEAHCERFDAESILQVSRIEHAAWLYFNHQRLFALADDLGVQLPSVCGFQRALAAGLIDGQGLPQGPSLQEPHMYHGGQGLKLYAYVRNVLHEVIQKLTIINISDMLDRGPLNFLLAPGDFIFVQGAHTFKKQNACETGPGQISQGTRQAHGVAVSFVLDRWEATSVSAWAVWLTGRRRAGSLIHVKNTDRVDGTYIIEGTVLAISNGHSELKRRDYGPK